MKLYAYNCSQQEQQVNYRMIESNRAHHQTIPIGIGQCILVGKADLDQKNFEYIVEQMRPYGWMSLSDARGIKDKATFIPIVFHDAPINFPVLYSIVDHNRGVLEQTGKDLRRQAAIVTSNALNQVDPLAGRSLEMLVKEDKPGGVDHNDGTNEVLTMHNAPSNQRGRRERK